MIIDKSVYLKTSTNKKLYSLLREILDYDDFVYGIMEFCQTDENQQKMIDVIESGVKDRNEICLWAVSLHRGKDINKLKEKWL